MTTFFITTIAPSSEKLLKVSLMREQEEKPIEIAESIGFRGLSLGSSGNLLLACAKKELWLFNSITNTVTQYSIILYYSYL